MSLKHEEPRHADQHGGVFMNVVSLPKGPPFRVGDGLQKGRLVYGGVDRGIGLVAADSHGQGLRGHGIRHGHEVVGVPGGGPLDGDIEPVDDGVLVGMK